MKGNELESLPKQMADNQWTPNGTAQIQFPLININEALIKRLCTLMSIR